MRRDRHIMIHYPPPEYGEFTYPRYVRVTVGVLDPCRGEGDEYVGLATLIRLTDTHAVYRSPIRLRGKLGSGSWNRDSQTFNGILLVNSPGFPADGPILVPWPR